jgi:hypothetical protein
MSATLVYCESGVVFWAFRPGHALPLVRSTQICFIPVLLEAFPDLYPQRPSEAVFWKVVCSVVAKVRRVFASSRFNGYDALEPCTSGVLDLAAPYAVEALFALITMTSDTAVHALSHFMEAFALN